MSDVQLRLVCVGGPHARSIITTDRDSIDFLVNQRGHVIGGPSSINFTVPADAQFLRVRYIRQRFAGVDVMLYERTDPTQMLEILLRSYADAEIGEKK